MSSMPRLPFMPEHAVTTSPACDQPRATRAGMCSESLEQGLWAFRCNGSWYDEFWYQCSPAAVRPVFSRPFAWLRNALSGIARLNCALAELAPDARPASTKFHAEHHAS